MGGPGWQSKKIREKFFFLTLQESRNLFYLCLCWLVVHSELNPSPSSWEIATCFKDFFPAVWEHPVFTSWGLNVWRLWITAVRSVSFYASDEAPASAFGKMKTKARLPLILFIVVALWLYFLNDSIEVEHCSRSALWKAFSSRLMTDAWQITAVIDVIPCFLCLVWLHLRFDVIKWPNKQIIPVGLGESKVCWYFSLPLCRSVTIAAADCWLEIVDCR